MNAHKQAFAKLALALGFDDNYDLIKNIFIHPDTQRAYLIWCGGHIFAVEERKRIRRELYEPT